MPQVTLHLGDNLAFLKTLPDNSVDSIVTDPPYFINFMGKKWDEDDGTYFAPLWVECLRVLKPGGYLAAFGATRTVHKLATAVEGAGFKIVNQLCWFFGQGFPKGLDIGKAIDKDFGLERETSGLNMTPDGRVIGLEKSGSQPIKDSPLRAMIQGIKTRNAYNTAPASDLAKEWDGWSTALKPAYEPIILAQKRISFARIFENVLFWRTGAFNINACRVNGLPAWIRLAGTVKDNFFIGKKQIDRQSSLGRWPANLIHDGSESVQAFFPETGPSKRAERGAAINSAHFAAPIYESTVRGHEDDGGSAARYFPVCRWGPEDAIGFYCPKISTSERNAGCSEINILNGLELVLENRSFTVENLFLEQWGKQDQNQSTDLRGGVLLQKDISEDIVLSLVDKDLSTALFGKNITDLFPQVIKFTTLMGSKLTIELKTLNFYQALSTSESIQDVIETNQVNGLSHVQNVAFTNLLKLIFTKDQTGLAHGVKVVAKKTPLSISVKEGLMFANIHNTVKPVALMEWLIKLLTASGGTVLDPFMGSGSTGMAAVRNGFNFIGAELDPEYHKIATARIQHAQNTASGQRDFTETAAPAQTATPSKSIGLNPQAKLF